MGMVWVEPPLMLLRESTPKWGRWMLAKITLQRVTLFEATE